MKKKIFLFFFALLFGIGLAVPLAQPSTVYAEEPDRIVQVEQNHESINNTSSGMIETDDYDPFEGYKGGDWTKFNLKKPPGIGFHSLFEDSGILGWFANWISYFVLCIMQFFAGLSNDITKIDSKGYFTNDAMKTMQMFFYDLSLLSLGVGIVFSAVDTAVQYQNGNGNVAAAFSGFIKAVVFTLCFVVVIPQFYRTAVDMSAVIMGNGIADSIGSVVRWLFGPGNFVVPSAAGKLILSEILLIIFTIMYVKHLYAVCKRALVLLSFMAKGSVMPFALARNSTSAFTSFANEFVMFLLGCILQEWAFYTGVSVLANGSLLTGFALITCSNEVFSYLGTVRADGENVMRDMHDIVCTASNVGQGIAKLATGDVVGAAASAAHSVSQAATQSSSSGSSGGGGTSGAQKV